MSDIYDLIEERLRMGFTPGPAGSFIYKGNRLVQGVIDPANNINRTPGRQVDWMINQAIERTRQGSGQYSAQELLQQSEMYLDQIAQSARYLEPYWDTHYSQAMQQRMGSARQMTGERLSPLSFSQYRDLQGYGIREKDGSREAIDLLQTMRATPGYVETDPGTFMVGTSGNKLPKRFQLEAQFHVNLADREREFSPIRMEGADAPEQGYRLDAAIPWSGGLPAGQGMMQTGEFSPWGVKRGSFFINPEEADKWTSAEVGQAVMRGGKVTVGDFGGVPYEVPVKSWETGALRDVNLNKRTGEVTYGIDWAGGAISLKDQGIKSLLLEGDIGKVLSGGRADVMFERPSDVRQFAYGVLSGQAPERLQSLGVPLDRSGQIVWDKTTDKALTGAFRQIMREDTSMETMTMRYDESMAAPFIASYRSANSPEARKFLRGIYPSKQYPNLPNNPLNVTGISQDDKGIWTIERQVPVTRTGFQASPKREWEYGKTSLSLEELSKLSEVNPGLANRLWREGARTRVGYQQPIRAQAATFRGADPGRTVGFNELPWEDILASAQQIGGEEFSSHALMQAMGQYSKKGTMLSMEVGGKQFYLPSAQTMLQHTTLTPEGGIQTRMPSDYANLMQRALEYQGMEGVAGAEQPVREAMFRYLKSQASFAQQPGVRKMAEATQLGQAVEGVYHGMTSLKPGEIFLGDERLKRMFGIDPVGADAESQLSQLKELLPFNNPDRALATGFRRPVSDSGQVGGLFTLVSEQELLRRQPELAGADLSNVMGLGGIEAAMQRGDFDADRFLSLMASTVKVGPDGVSMRSGTELQNLFVEQNRVGQLIEGLGKIAPQGFQRHFDRLASAIGEKPTAFASAFFPGVESNELAKWAEDLNQFGSMQGINRWLGQQLNLQASVGEVQSAFTQQATSKMMMGISYNQWIRTMSSQLPRAQQTALAEMYQKPLDNQALPEPIRKLMELQQTYNIAGGLKEDGSYKHAGGYAKIFHDYVSDEAGVHPDTGFIRGGLAGVAGQVAGVATSPESHEVMAPEGWARILADSEAPYEGILKAIKGGGEGISQFINRDWLTRAESPLAKTFMSAAYRRGSNKQFLSDQGAFVMNPESWQAQLAEMGRQQQSSIWMAKPKRSSFGRYAQNLWSAIKSPFTTKPQAGYLQQVAGDLGLNTEDPIQAILGASQASGQRVADARASLEQAVVRPAGAGQPPQGPPPPVAEGWMSELPEDNDWLNNVQPIPYGNEPPFSPNDLSAAERAEARKTPIKAQDTRREALVQAAQQRFAGEMSPNQRGWWKDENGVFMAGVTEEDPVKQFRQLSREYSTLSAGLSAALKGENIFEMPGLDIALEGMKKDPTSDLLTVSRAAASGKIGGAAVGALSRLKRTVLQQETKLTGLASTTGEPMPQGMHTNDLIAQLAEWEGQVRGGKGGKGVDMDRLAETFEKMQKGAERFTGAMDKTQKALDFTEEALTKEFGSPHERKANLAAAGKQLGIQEARLKASMKGWAGDVSRLEGAGAPEDDERMIALRDRRDSAAAQLRRIQERRLDVREEQADMALQESTRTRGHRSMALFGLAMLPWQLQFADQWGTAQSQQAFQYAAGIDQAMGQAGFAAGYVPPAGLVGQSNQIQANQNWAQYFMGQGAAASMTESGFWADRPGWSRARGALGNYGRYLGYGLAGEMVVQQTLGRGFFTGENPMLFGSGLVSKIGGIGAAGALGYLGINAAVDVVNATQDRTMTTGEGVSEAGRNLARIAGGVQGWVAGQMEGAGIFPKAAHALREGLAETYETQGSMLGDTESEIRDRARKASPVYKRQQAILDAMKEQGLSPDQAASYSTIYAQMGILDPQKQAEMAARAFGLEQMSGLNVGQLAGSTMGIVQKLGYMPGSQQNLQQQFYSMLENYAQNQPQRYQALSAGLDTAAGMVGEWPARLGMGQDWTAQFTQHTGQMLANGTPQWEVNKYIQNQTLSTPRAWSRKMQQMGYEDLVLQDDLGRPATFALQQQVRDTGRALDIERTQMNFGIEAEQLGLDRQWMTRGWAAEDTIKNLRNRYRVEDADMGIASLALRLESAQQSQQQQQQQRELWEKQLDWQESDIETSMARASTQYGWQQAEFNRNRQQSQTQFGWQMEDINEAIRFSSGRQRQQLLKQRERMGVQQNWKTADLNTAEQQAATQYGWKQEDYEKQLDRLRQEADLRRQMMDQDAEQNQKSLDLLKKQYEQEVQRRKELVEQIIPAEQEQEAIQREQAEKGLEWREKRHNMDVKYFETMQPLQDKLTQATDKMQEAWALWQTTMEEGVPNASAIFLKNFGEDSSAYRALKKWQELLENFDKMGSRSGGGGSIDQAVQSSIQRWMERYMPTYNLR